MDILLPALKKCRLFSGIDEDEINNYSSQLNFKAFSYAKNEILAIEGDKCSSLGIVLDGTIEVQKHHPSGKIISLTRLQCGDVFAEAIVFSDRSQFPNTLTSVENSEILYITKQNIIKLCSSNSIIFSNMLAILSNKILMLNFKIKELSLDNLRAKICFYLYEEYKKQNSLSITLPMDRNALAQSLGIQRPSLSRELSNMKNDGIIDFNKNVVEIKDLNSIIVL
jgi:CRP-like cAMP-binding protein